MEQNSEVFKDKTFLNCHFHKQPLHLKRLIKWLHSVLPQVSKYSLINDRIRYPEPNLGEDIEELKRVMM